MNFPISFITREKKELLSATLQEYKLLKAETEQALLFIENITRGQLDTVATTGNTKNVLIEKLEAMRIQLKKTASDEQERNWTTAGIAMFSTILQNSDKDIYDNVLSNLLRYLNVNQGAIFLANTDEKNATYLEMVACYAYQKKKQQQISFGVKEGLVGQCYSENDTILITKVPDNYVNITSGLGESLPSFLLLVPLKTADKTLGVIELASFHVLKKHQIAFVEQLAGNIGNSIANIQINAKTQQLLLLSQQQSEEMRAAEEEMRQNMEELSATQEEMGRKEWEMRSVLSVVNQTVSTVEFDMNGTILAANEAFLKLMDYSLEEILGKHHRIFAEKSYTQSREYQDFWNKLNDESGDALAGEFQRVGKNGKKVWLKGTYSAIADMGGNPYKVVKYAQDITELKNLEEINNEAKEKLSNSLEETKSIQQVLETKNAEMNAIANALNASLATIEFDLDGNILNANNNFLKLMGYNLDEILGKQHRIFLEDGYARSNEYRNFWNSLRANQSNIGEVKRLSKKGNYIWLSASYTPILGLDGKPCKIIKFAQDITALKTQISKGYTDSI